MKHLILSFCILCSTLTSFSQISYKFHIIDAGEANKIYTATGGSAWTVKYNWPISEGVTIGLKTPFGVRFAFGDTSIIHYPPPAVDTGIIDVLIKELNLEYNNLSGALPAFAMDSLTIANFYNNQLTGIGNIQAPVLEILSISGNAIGTLPVFNLPKLHSFYA